MFIVWVLIVLCIGNVVALGVLLNKNWQRPFPKLGTPGYNDITHAVTLAVCTGHWRSSQGEEK